MRRIVNADLTIDVATPARIVFAVAVARRSAGLDETLDIRLDGSPVTPLVIDDSHGTVLHQVDAEAGALTVTYEAIIDGGEPTPPVHPRDLIRYGRPSRYCESDILAPTAHAHFDGLEGQELLDGVSSWVGTQLEYVWGSSLSTDGAVRTLLAREGVCRDFAHLCIALLRARDVPARLVAVYAPGLEPMDFHAVCEAFVDGRWSVVDATALAPRSTLVRIATGRDAADTAFMSVLSGKAQLIDMKVGAVVDTLPDDDLTASVQLG